MQFLQGLSITNGIAVIQDYVTPASSAPTFAVTPVTSSVNEGSNVTFNITGTNIPATTTYYWSVQGNTGSGISTLDFVENVGSIQITNNAASFSVSPTSDITTEGSELFTVALRANTTSGTILATSSSVTITDTSLSPPSYSVSPASSSVDEGTALTFNVSGSYIIDGTYYWTVNNITSSNIDFTANSGSFAITSNAGSFTVTANADLTTEGAELYTASVRTGSVTGNIVATSSSVTINDTSVLPATLGSFKFAGDDFIRIPYNAKLGQDVAFTTEWWWKHDTFYAAPKTLPVAPMGVFGTVFVGFNDGADYSDTYYPYITVVTASTFNNGYINNSGVTSMSSGVTASNWNHFALVGQGTNAKFYINGNLVTWTSGSPNVAINAAAAVSGTPMQIGRTGVTARGYLADFRHVNGTAVYTGNFTPPNKPLSPGGNALVYPNTANINTTFPASNCAVLLQKFSSTNNYQILDSSNYAATITNQNSYDWTGDINQNTIQGNTTPWPY